MGYAQPNLGHIITRLEDELGTKVFFRDQKGMRLTGSGEILLELMKEVDALEDRMMEIAQYFPQELLQVGTFSSVESQWIPAILAAVRDDYPDTLIKLKNLSTYREGATNIKSRSLDCAFSVGQWQWSKNLVSVPLYEDPYYLVVDEKNEFAQHSSVSLQEAAEKYPFIPNNETFDMDSAIWEIYQSMYQKMQFNFSPQENQVTLSLVERGLGITLLPEMVLLNSMPSCKVKAVPLEEPLSRTISLVYLKDSSQTSFVRAFLKLVEREIALWKTEKRSVLE